LTLIITIIIIIIIIMTTMTKALLRHTATITTLLLFLLLAVLLPQQSSAQSSSCSLSSSTERILIDDGSLLTMREVVDPDQNTITVEMVYQGEAWVAFGISNEKGDMIGAQAVIGLPDEGVVRKYDMTAEELSGVYPTGSQTLSGTSITQSNGVTTMTFTKKLVEDGYVISATGPNYFIYAVGSTNTLGLHAREGSFSTEALAVCGEASTNTETDTTTTDDEGTPQEEGVDSEKEDKEDKEGAEKDDSDNKDEQQEPLDDEEDETQSQKNRAERFVAMVPTLWRVHGWLMAISWGILTPIAVGCAVLRKFFPAGGVWFKYHSNINTLAFLTTTAGFAVAVFNIQTEAESHFSGLHELIGLLLFLMVALQVLSGWFRPHVPPEAKKASSSSSIADEEYYVDNGQDQESNKEAKKTKARVIFEYQHRILGLGLVILGWIECTLGFDNYMEYYELAFPAKSIFWGVTGTITAVIICGRIGQHVLDRTKK
jgi:hypothetical protein